MADPRTQRLTDGMLGRYLSFIQAGTMTSGDIGKSVSMSGNAGVKLCSDDTVIVGKLWRVDDTACVTVQVEGLAEVYTSGTIAVGDIVNGSTVSGYVKADNTDAKAGPIVVSVVSTGVALVQL